MMFIQTNVMIIDYYVLFLMNGCMYDYMVDHMFDYLCMIIYLIMYVCIYDYMIGSMCRM